MAKGASWRVWNLTVTNVLRPWRHNEAFANGLTYVRVPQTWEWLHVPPIRTRWTEDYQMWSCPRHTLRIVSQLGSRQLHVRWQGLSEAPPRWRCERWPWAGSWTWLICHVQWAWPPINQACFPGPTSQLNLVPCTSTVRGPVDEEFAENALRVFDPQAVAGRSIEGWSARSNTWETRGETRIGIVTDNGCGFGRYPWESQQWKHLRDVDGQGSGRVATSDATL